MSLKKFVMTEVETLSESELQSVAEYLSFLKFRSRLSSGGAQLAALDVEGIDLEISTSEIVDFIHDGRKPF
jgi:hypothetical protein